MFGILPFPPFLEIDIFQIGPDQTKQTRLLLKSTYSPRYIIGTAFGSKCGKLQVNLLYKYDTPVLNLHISYKYFLSAHTISSLLNNIALLFHFPNQKVPLLLTHLTNTHPRHL